MVDIEDGGGGGATGGAVKFLCGGDGGRVLVRKITAEFLGTLMLVFMSTAGAIVDEETGGAVTLPGLAACTGLAVMIVVMATGHISGAHINPAVTVAAATLRQFPLRHVPMYIAAQLVASVCSGFMLKLIFHPMRSGGVTVPSDSDSDLQAFLMEFIISFILMFVIAGVAMDNKAVGELAGITVGATVALNVLIAGKISGASMNPARTLGPAIASNNYKAIWIYFIAPPLGTLAGVSTYSIIKTPYDINEEQVLNKKSSRMTCP
ncbi:hypothetical protein J5N97_002633 [Dioscorea zingiberensis]|uniref:Uncharacterized protein n=1 Tax=Dioscorea zingiberensis TaxID=325984 RepID=A0A9D5D4H3_9LILI|nr:hypothetical protein J5N97_002633 [Dioscorea zingiberensis]